MGVLQEIAEVALRPLVRSNSSYPIIPFEQWIQLLSLNGGTLRQTLVPNEEPISADFEGLVQGAYKSNGVVFACMLARQLLFSEARFQFRQRRNGRPGDLFGNGDLQIVERPWANGTTGDLLSRAIQDADLAGNFFGARRSGNRIKRMRPDWTTIVLGSDRDPQLDGRDIDAEVIGYIYHPGGKYSGLDPETFLPNEVAHWAPIPDPSATFRGMSWVSVVAREVQADTAATLHKLKFFENGATPNMVVTLDKDIAPTMFKQWIETFEKGHKGVINAYKTIYLGGGADAKVVGSNMEQMSFKTTQGAGETRIAAAAGVPPVIVGLSEGLQAATYSNYGQARRRFADGTMRPLWRGIAGALATIINVPSDAELWYDDRDIPFLQEDDKDAAEIQRVESTSIRSLVDAGFTPESVIDAVTSRDLTRLVHTGLFSVQLQPPGTKQPDSAAPVPPGRAAIPLLEGLTR